MFEGRTRGLLTPSNTGIDATAPIGRQLLRILRERIINGDFPPGARLSEHELAAAYALSRQPVREAFIRLAEEGLLEIRPQRGSFVRKISIKEVRDARFVREAIEADIVRLLSGRDVDAVVEDLRRQVEAQRAIPNGDYVHFLQLDELFHRTLAEAAGNGWAWTVVESIKIQMDRVRVLTTAEYPKDLVVEQHHEIVEALAAHDADAAETAMRAHLQKLLMDLPAIAAAHPTFFET